MAIEQKYLELIHADIDGEISDVEKDELQAFIASSVEGRTLHEDLTALHTILGSVDKEEPPRHLRYVIMNAVKPMRAKPDFLDSLKLLFSAPALRYAMVFAAGVALTLSLVSSGQISERAFDDVTGLVGSVADPISATVESSVTLDETAIAGNVSLRRINAMLIVDFDLVAKGPIQIEADYPDESVWFNGFAQLESTGTTISTDVGRVTLRMEGKRRYAVYLHNRGERATTINLRFLADGMVIHQTSLEFEPAK